MKRLGLIMACLLLVSLFLVGCSSNQGYQEQNQESNTNQELTRDEIAEQEALKALEEMKQQQEAEKANSCVLLDDCSQGTAMCYFGRCWTSEELSEEFPSCGSEAECDSMPCANCDSGARSCMRMAAAGTSGMKSQTVCAECLRDDHCLDGFTCEVGKCI